MANEFTASVTGSFLKNAASDIFAASNSVTINGSYFNSGIQLVGTSDEVIALIDIGTVGWVFFKNLDATNYVLAGADGTNYCVKIQAGEACLFRWNGAAVHVKANTASVKLQYKIFED
jgi:hypothetical protein